MMSPGQWVKRLEEEGQRFANWEAETWPGLVGVPPWTSAYLLVLSGLAQDATNRILERAAASRVGVVRT